jgi:hypothetical protein
VFHKSTPANDGTPFMGAKKKATAHARTARWSKAATINSSGHSVSLPTKIVEYDPSPPIPCLPELIEIDDPESEGGYPGGVNLMISDDEMPGNDTDDPMNVRIW